MKFTLISSAFIATALATTHQVTIGPGLSYSPNTVTAAAGDIVSFKFGSGHNVVSGSFDSPCQPDGTIYSGDGSEGDVFSVTINGTDPIWLYCSVPHHCQGGMVMVINAPSDHTLSDYKSAAASTSGSSEPDNVMGGIYGNAAAVSSASSSSSSSASSSAMMTSSTRTASSSGSATSSSSMASSSSSASSGAQAVGVSVGLLGLSALWSVMFA